MRDNLRQAAAKMRGLEDVCEDAADVDPGSLIGIETQCAMAKIQRPNVVEAEDVISMTMSHQHRIEVFQSVTQGLLAEIRRSINDYGLTRVLD
jgi:hypothetical protein